MRLLVGALVCFGTLQITAGLASANPSELSQPQYAVLAGDHVARPETDWLALDHTDRTTDDATTNPTDFDQHDRGPVLLPLPTEAWTSATLLVSLACFRGLKRARFL